MLHTFYLLIPSQDINDGLMDVYKAIADQVRRKIIEQLATKQAAQDGLSIKQLCAGKQVSRQAVTKHLDVLIKLKLVIAEYIGKERRHFLLPGKLYEPLLWLQPIAKQWEDTLGNLKTHLAKQRD